MRRAVTAVVVLAVVFVGLLVYVVIYQRGEPRGKNQLFDFAKGDVARIELVYSAEGEDEESGTVLIEKRPEDDPIRAVARKSVRTGSLVAAIVLGLGVVVAVVAAFAPPESDRRSQTFTKVALVGLIIALLGGAGIGVVVYFASDRVSKDYTWEIVRPLRARGDTDSVDTLADNIATLTAASTFNRQEQERLQQPENMKEAGLNSPEFVVRAWDLKGRLLAKVAVGKSMSVGSDLYAQVNDRDFVTIGSWKVDQLKKKAGDLRDKSVVRVEPDDVTGLELRYANSSIMLKKEKKDDSDEEYDWFLTKPIQAKGDRYDCDDLVNKIKDLKVEEFIEKDEEKPLQEYGLDEPEITAIVSLKDGKQEAVYISAKRDPDTLDKVYCRAKGRDEVFLVDDKVLEDLRKQPIDLRDKKVCDFDTSDVERLTVKYKGKTYVIVRKSDDEWYLEQPQKGKCDYGKVDDIRWYMKDLNADEFVAETPAEDDLPKWGLDKPTAEVTAHLKDGEVTVLIGTHVEKDAQMYVKRADKPTVVLTSDTLLRHLPESPDDLLEKPEEGESGSSEGGGES